MPAANIMNKDLLLKNRRITASGCWEWTGCIYLNSGYGKISIRCRIYLTHRVAAHLYTDFDLHSKLKVCHKCDNKLCFNPDHLFIGTQKENMLDCAKKERFPHAILTWGKVKEIRSLLQSGHRPVELAERFDVCRSTIYMIKNNRQWVLD